MEFASNRVGFRTLKCYSCNKEDYYMVNLNDIKCKYCQSPAVEFIKKK